MDLSINKVVVIGLGYIGLPTAANIAAQEIPVVGVDINSKIIDTINAGSIHIVEPDLDVLVHKVVSKGLLHASSMPEHADVFLITVPTPFKDNYQPDLSYVENAARSIASFLRKGNLVILESTSPVGTTEQVSTLLADLRNDLIFPHQNSDHPDIHIAYCPERVMPGKIMSEIIHNVRIIGGITPICGQKAKHFYKLFVKGDCFTIDSRTAEMTKLTENAFRDVNIAFANELSIICDKLNVNVIDLINFANHHPRVNILQPGAGVGGHCIAVDPWFIVKAAPKEAKLIHTARQVNDKKPKFILKKIKAAAKKHREPTIACFGLTYKANTDDLRESPAIKIVEELANTTTYRILVVEPNINELPPTLKIHLRLKLVTTEEALNDANVAVFLVAHEEFKFINKDNLDKLKLINAAYVDFSTSPDPIEISAFR